MSKKKKRANPAPLLNQDVVNLIANYISYTEGLFAFRQTSKHNNFWVENTDAGQLARKASALEPSWMSTSVNSFCKNKEQKINLAAWVGSSACILSVIGLADFYKGINVLSIGTGITAGIAGFLGGLIIVVASSDEKTKYYRVDNYIDAISSSFILYIFNVIVSLFAGIVASIFVATLSTFWGFSRGVPMLEVCFLSTHEPNKLHIDIVIGKIMEDILHTAVKVSGVTSVIGAFFRFAVLANNDKVEKIQRKQSSIRKTLHKPYSHPINFFPKKTSSPEIEDSNLHYTL